MTDPVVTTAVVSNPPDVPPSDLIASAKAADDPEASCAKCGKPIAIDHNTPNGRWRASDGTLNCVADGQDLGVHSPDVENAQEPEPVWPVDASA